MTGDSQSPTRACRQQGAGDRSVDRVGGQQQRALGRQVLRFLLVRHALAHQRDLHAVAERAYEAIEEHQAAAVLLRIFSLHCLSLESA
jgi:hypothetical protein